MSKVINVMFCFLLIVYEQTGKWYIEWQRVTRSGTTNDNEWHQMITNGNGCYKEWQRAVTNKNKCSFRLIYYFF